MVGKGKLDHRRGIEQPSLGEDVIFLSWRGPDLAFPKLASPLCLSDVRDEPVRGRTRKRETVDIALGGGTAVIRGPARVVPVLFVRAKSADDN